MREIKFRAWDKKNKCFSGNLKAGVTTLDAWKITPNGTVVYYDYPLGGELILMQYTGLKDKNGVEIYEGDIVKYKFADTHIAEVKWGFWEEEMSTGIGFYFPMFFEKDEIEILGNIYENPELVKKL